MSCPQSRPDTVGLPAERCGCLKEAAWLGRVWVPRDQEGPWGEDGERIWDVGLAETEAVSTGDWGGMGGSSPGANVDVVCAKVCARFAHLFMASCSTTSEAVLVPLGSAALTLYPRSRQWPGG